MAENSGKSLEMIPQGLHFGTFWVTFGALCALLVHFVASVFQAHFPGPKKELRGLWWWAGAGGSGALAGGGVPFQVTLVRLAGRKFHTPSGQAWPGAADLKASPLPPAPC